MIDRQLDEEKIFHIARGIDAADLRADYLAQICAGEQALQERVEALLEAHEKEQSLLKSNVVIEPTADFSGVTETAGEHIGRYKLLQKIGEGGFGVVYMAEQCRPVRRKVALKLIKPGMDTRAVVARFEAERQALALMDHANIAKVFDGGATESGRPYFVMELVKGVPITEFCDENRLDVRQRLDLFVKVCQAIQHAHQKGVIHRDIKPANVMVTLHDGDPVPKVIDFGVSKAISQQLTEKTLFTAHGQMIGTPQYMSPEQAEMSGLDIDTRSDIYSLGILLYELLTGCTPLDPARIRGTAYLELQRMIREDEPIHPSRRCSTQGEYSATVAAKRKTDPRKLGHALRGELDWLVMKTLEKDRNRRYASASDLATDVQHFLNDETVDACPPSMVYRFQKFARRNKTLLLTGGTVVVLLVASALIGWTLYIRAEDAARAAKTERDIAQKALKDNSDLRRQQMIEVIFSLAASNRFSEAEERIKNAGVDFKAQGELFQILKAVQKSTEGYPADAVDILEMLEPDENDVILQALLANAQFDAGEYWTYYGYPVVQGSLRPSTAYEYLFVGKAMFWPDFKQSLDYLDEAVLLTHSPLSLTYRARSSALLASSIRADVNKTKELEVLIGQAVDDIETAARLFQTSRTVSEKVQIDPTVQGTHLLVLLHAYDIYNQLALRHGEQELKQEAEEAGNKADEVMVTADRLCTALSEQSLDNVAYVRSWLGFYLQRKAAQLDDQGRQLEAQQKNVDARKLLEHSFGPYLAVADILRIDPKEKQLVEDRRKALLKTMSGERSQSPSLAIAVLHMLDEDVDSRRENVSTLINDLKQTPTIENVFQICLLYLLVDQPAECRDYAVQQLASNDQFQDLPVARFGLEYFSKENSKDSDDEYLRKSKGSGPETFRTFAVGLMNLANGDRDEALRRFRQVEREGIFHTWEYELASAMVERMDRDPSWPQRSGAPRQQSGR